MSSFERIRQAPKTCLASFSSGNRCATINTNLRKLPTRKDRLAETPIHQEIHRHYAEMAHSVYDVVRRAKSASTTSVAPPSKPDPSGDMPRRAKLAYHSYQVAEKMMEPSRKTDREAYDWFKAYLDNGEEFDGYNLPAFNTWARQLREARKILGQQKNKPRAGRSTGPSVATHNEIPPSRKASD